MQDATANRTSEMFSDDEHEMKSHIHDKRGPIHEDGKEDHHNTDA